MGQLGEKAQRSGVTLTGSMSLSEKGSPTKPSRMFAMDALKALAIVAVVAAHTDAWYSGPCPSLLLYLLTLGQAMSFFAMVMAYLSARRMGSGRSGFTPLNVALSRYIVPYGVAFAAMGVLLLLTGRSVMGLANPLLADMGNPLANLAEGFLLGGPGLGGYFVPTLIQLLILIPTLYGLFVRRPALTCVSVAIAVLMNEASLVLGIIDDAWYRLLAIRQLPFVIWGFIAFRLQKLFGEGRFPRTRIVLACSMVVGAAYLVAVWYMGYDPVLYGQWTLSGLPSSFWSGSVFCILVAWSARRGAVGNEKQGSRAEAKRGCAATLRRAIERVGSSTYGIFLFQMIWFVLLQRFASYAALPASVQLGANLVTCLACGVLVQGLIARLAELPNWANLSRCTGRTRRNDLSL